eukprot:2532768-Prymnesium_polylepis.2
MPHVTGHWWRTSAPWTGETQYACSSWHVVGWPCKRKPGTASSTHSGGGGACGTCGACGVPGRRGAPGASGGGAAGQTPQ